MLEMFNIMHGHRHNIIYFVYIDKFNNIDGYTTDAILNNEQQHQKTVSERCQRPEPIPIVKGDVYNVENILYHSKWGNVY